MERKVWAFFYGSFMNSQVMATANLIDPQIEIASLPGFDIEISPHANLVRRAGQMAYGLLVSITHAQLDSLYASQSAGETYLPEAVLAIDAGGRFRPATCYIVTNMKPGVPEKSYLEKITAPAIAHGFPDWYVNRLRSFVDAES
jgi:hypothetical protein